MHSPRLCTLLVQPGLEHRFDPPCRLHRLKARAWLKQPSTQHNLRLSGENLGLSVTAIAVNGSLNAPSRLGLLSGATADRQAGGVPLTLRFGRAGQLIGRSRSDNSVDIAEEWNILDEISCAMSLSKSPSWYSNRDGGKRCCCCSRDAKFAGNVGTELRALWGVEIPTTKS